MSGEGSKPIPINTNVPLTPNQSPIQNPFIFKLGSEITPRAVDWLWKNYLARRKITLLAGDSGTAKTTLTLSWAARLSNGGLWPDNSGPVKPGYTLVYSIEDDDDDTHVPHVMAHGGKLDKIVFLKGKRNFDGHPIAFNPTTDFQHLLNYINTDERLKVDLDLIIIDPIITIVKGDANQNNKVREALQVISELAKEFNCAVVAIIHFRKDSHGHANRKVLDRVLHSGAFVQVSRIVLNTVKVKGTDEYWLIRSKVSNGVASGGFRYSIEPGFVAGNIETTRINVLGPLEGNPDELIAEAEGISMDDNNTNTQVGRAKELVRISKKYDDASIAYQQAHFKWRVAVAIGKELGKKFDAAALREEATRKQMRRLNGEQVEPTFDPETGLQMA
jgi:hypothetical protein